MKGNWIYYTAASLLGVSAKLSSSLFFYALLLFLILLCKQKKFPPVKLAIICGLFLVNLIRSDFIVKSNHTHISKNETNFMLSFQENITVNGDTFTTNAKELIYDEKLIVNYKFKTEKEKMQMLEALKPGIACKVRGSLVDPNWSRNKNAFNYKQYLNRNQIYWIVKLENFHASSCYPLKKTPLTFLNSLRQEGINFVHTQFPVKSAPLAIALLFGERDFIDDTVLKAYERLGIVHLLAISGLHVGMLSGMIYFLGIRVGITREKMISALLLFLPIYAILTGATPSVIRAVSMLMLFLGLKKWGHPFALTPLDIFGIVCMIYLFVAPFVIFNVGFQLSFGVSFSLILSSTTILQRFSHPISLLFVTSFICQLAAAPILLVYFYEISLISVLANIVYVPLFSFFILPAIFLIFLLHLMFGGAIQYMISILDSIIIWMDVLASRLAQFPFAMLTLGKPPPFLLCLYLVALPAYFSLWERIKNRKRILLIQMIPVTIISFHACINLLSPYGEISFIDVGQGDSIFIRLPFGQGNYLIDTGGRIQFQTENWKVRNKEFDIGKDVVIPFLKSKGITTIHKLILTHGDMDHTGEADDLLKELNVKELILPKSNTLSDLEKNIIELAEKKRIHYRFAEAGESWKAGSIHFHVLSPLDGEPNDRNNGSIVLYTKFGGLTWLLTGDLEAEGEKKLIAAYPNLKANILKAGHHGSQSSTTEVFLDHIKPKVAIISAGKNNRYGHPNKEVLKNLHDRNVKVFRTDQHGGITYIFRHQAGTFSLQIP